jgi:hypothetical protein
VTVMGRQPRFNRNSHHLAKEKQFKGMPDKMRQARLNNAATAIITDYTRMSNQNRGREKQIPLAMVWTIAGTHRIPPEYVKQMTSSPA